MERCITAFAMVTKDKDRDAVFEEVAEKLSSNDVSPLLIIFSAAFDDFEFFSAKTAERFPGSQTIGMVSFTSYSDSGIAENCFSAMAVYSGIECASGVLTDIDRCPILHKDVVEEAVRKLSDEKNCVCLSFTTALFNSEELVLDTFACVFGRNGIPVYGCTSGYKKETRRSLVALNGKVFDKACVFVIVKNLNGRIAFIKENIYKPSRFRFTATNINFKERTLYELDNRPAAPYIAGLLGISVPEFAKRLTMHPLGRISGNDIYTAQGKEVQRDGSITFYAHIYNYTNLVLLEADDISRVQKQISNDVAKQSFKPSFSISVCCVLVEEIFNESGDFVTFAKTLSDSCGKYLGLTGYGEQLDFVHLNKTIILALFE